MAEIGAASGLEEITVISILGKLAEAGVLLVKAERQSRAEDDVELQAHRDSVWAEVSQLLDDIADEPGASAGRQRRGRTTARPSSTGAVCSGCRRRVAAASARVSGPPRRNAEEAGGPSGRPPLLALVAGGPAAAGSPVFVLAVRRSRP